MAGTIIQRGSGFTVVMDHGRDPKTGKRIRKWTSFKSRREAEVFRAQSATHPAFAAGVGVYGSTRKRLGEFLTQWLKDYASLKVRPRTYQCYEQFIRSHITPRLVHVALPRLTPHMIQNFYAEMLVGGLSKTTVHHIGVLLREVLDHALRWGIIAQNPSALTDIPERGTPTIRTWTVEQAAAFLDEARRSSKHPLFYELAITTGLRAGELLALQWGDFDLTRGLLHVASGKTASAKRTVLLPEELVSKLRRQRGLGLVFHTRNGTALGLNNLRFQDFSPTIKRAKLPRVRIHDLRHFHASLLLANGVDIASVAGRMGHASKSFTLATYGHEMSGGQERAAAVANQLLTQTEAGEGSRRT